MPWEKETLVGRALISCKYEGHIQCLFFFLKQFKRLMMTSHDSQPHRGQAEILEEDGKKHFYTEVTYILYPEKVHSFFEMCK